MRELVIIFNDLGRLKNRNKILPSNLLSDDLDKVLTSMDEYLSKNTGTEKIENWDLFSAWFFAARWPGLSATQRDLFQGLFSYASKNTMTASEEDVFLSLITQHYADLISDVCFDIGSKQILDHEPLCDLIQPLLDEYKKKIDEQISTEIETDIDGDIFSNLFESETGQNGFSWCIEELNQAIGPLSPGNFIILGGRPDAGKTTLLASQVSLAARQLAEGDTIQWLTNEERASRIKLRILQSVLETTQADILHNFEEKKKEYLDIIPPDAVAVHNIYGWSTQQVEKLLLDESPRLVILDQLAKINYVGTTSNDADRLAKLAAKARSWCVDFPVITTCWADSSAENEKYIETSQLYGSKTGFPGEADAVITIGRIMNDAIPTARYLYVPKNKCAGRDPAKRNGKFEVNILPELARFGTG